MTTNKAQKVVLAAGIIALATGVVNSLAQNKRPPSPQFLVGLPGLFVGFYFLARSEPELANAFAAAAATYAVLGDHGGILARIAPAKELDTAPPKQTAPGPHPDSRVMPPRVLRMIPVAVESSN